MKRLVCIVIAISFLFCSGCRHISTMDSSAYENHSDVVSEHEDSIEKESESLNTSEESYIHENSSKASSNAEQTISNPTQTIPTSPTNAQPTVVIDENIKKETAVEIKEADVNTKGTKPLTYTTLTDEQQRIYRLLSTAVSQMNSQNISLGDVSNREQRLTDIAVALRSLSADCPDMFWMPLGYASSADGSVIAFATEKANYYTVSKDKLSSAKSQLDAIIQKVATNASKFSSRFEKELYFHDYLCESVEYDYSLSSGDMAYTAYGALVNGVAVCEGYSRAMQLLCDRVGIPCALVYGSHGGEGHMWNVIDPGDGWYHLDITWDDTITTDYQLHTYFNLTEKQMVKDHTIADMVDKGKNYASNDNFNLNLYRSENESYNFFVKKGYVFGDDIKAVKKAIITRNQEGHNYAEFLYKNPNDINSIISQLNGELCLENITLLSYSYAANSLLLIWQG